MKTPPILALLSLLLSCYEAQSSTQAIVGGVIDDARPYVVGVGANSVVFCSGTLISSRTVLTAAHCQGPNKVFFGVDASSPSLTVLSVQQLKHPAFNTSDAVLFDHDLQLLFLEAAAPVQPAPLFRQTLDSSSLGSPLTLVGFGVTSGSAQDDGFKRSTQAALAAVGPSMISGGSVDFIDETQLYFQDALHNTCNGDSGGPSFLLQGKIEQLVGVTSFGDADCAIDGVNARTDLALLASFIQPQLELFEAANPCRSDGVCEASCTQSGEVLDPDCQSLHCLTDGVCALACVSPRDADCDEPGVDHCLANGICDPTCSSLDPDCVGLCQSGDSCVRACASPDPDCVVGLCGDGVLDESEECDDADQDNDDACDANCQRLGCGDALLNHGEGCDDGNLVDGDGCSARCKPEFCGDRLIQGDESCDDGNQNNDDGCSEGCQPPRCGDGFVQISLGERCDDGNNDSGDGCDEECSPEAPASQCGDASLDGEEQCDDGNLNSEDGCSDLCQLEFSGGSCAVGGVWSSWWLLLLWVGLLRRMHAKK
jgi:cysteine-rich repeat protein